MGWSSRCNYPLGPRALGPITGEFRGQDIRQCLKENTEEVRPERLKELRQRLDCRLAGQGLNLPRLAKRLGALLAAPRRESWAFAQTDGQIDAGRLSRLMISPEQREIFRHEHERPHSDCVVSLLIDNSGSMRNHIEHIALLADAFSRALELAGARSEILGFTTGQWNGGRPMTHWRGMGQPANPGRLNELSHLVYKDAETSWRRARPSPQPSALGSLAQAKTFRVALGDNVGGTQYGLGLKFAEEFKARTGDKYDAKLFSNCQNCQLGWPARASAGRFLPLAKDGYRPRAVIRVFTHGPRACCIQRFFSH